MKVLFTGQPKVGKSTLFASLLTTISNKQGFITQEIKEQDQRIGFKLVSAVGEVATLADTQLSSEYQVSRYFVDVSGLTEFIQPLFIFKPDQLLYIDEIGQMELFADDFKKLVEVYLEAENDFIGTITSVYSDAFVEKLKSLDSILLIVLTPENRAEILEIAKAMIIAFPLIKTLSQKQQEEVRDLAAGYFKTEQYIQLKKLFNNAIRYVANQSVTQISSSAYEIIGNTAKHIVTKKTNGWTCDCDLFNGQGLYTGKAGECSHIQAVELLMN